MKSILTTIKPYLRWFILGGTLFFLIKNFKDRWQEVAAIHISDRAYFLLLGALLITLVAHVWSGWVWTWILIAFKQSMGTLSGIRVYLLTNIAKYLPGNIWHFYGRISAVTKNGGSLSVATVSVLLEPLLMAAAALLVGSIAMGFNWHSNNFQFKIIGIQFACLLIILLGIHPYFLNPIINQLSRSKNKQQIIDRIELKNYPLMPFIGEISFVILRSIGFILTLMALQSISLAQIPALISAFSFAWLLGLIVPGAPGGMGIFEVTAITLLNGSQFPEAIVLTTVALFRLISILAEAIAAGIAYIKR
jgi:hypothetical protein